MRVVIEDDEAIATEVRRLDDVVKKSDSSRDDEGTPFFVGSIADLPIKKTGREVALVAALRALKTGDALLLLAPEGEDLSRYGGAFERLAGRLRSAGQLVASTRATLEDQTVLIRTRSDPARGGVWGWFEIPQDGFATGGHAEV